MKYAEKYDEKKRPPAPWLKITLENPVSEESVATHFYIDTGFDGSLLITNDLWHQLNLSIVEVEDEAYAVHGGFMPIKLRAALVNIQISDYRIEKLVAYMHPLLKRPLMGRELLNNFYLYLKGPKRIAILSSENMQEKAG